MGTSTVRPAVMSERDLLDAVLSLCKLYGWHTLHIRPARTDKGWRSPLQGDGVGFPDIFAVRGDRQVAVELKGAGGRVTPEQQAWLNALSDHAETYVWRPEHFPAEVVRVLKPEKS